MISMLVSWVALAIGFWAAAALLPGMKIKGGAKDHLVASAIFGLLMYFFGSALYVAIGMGTLGLGFVLGFITRLVVGSLLLLMLTDKLSNRLTIDGFRTAIVAALIVSVVGSGAEYAIEHVLH